MSALARRRTAGLAALLMLFGAVSIIALPADADHPTAQVQPTVQQGNPACSDFGLDFVTKFESNPVSSGTQVGVTITVDGGAQTFDWTANQTISMVIVKGGPVANIYDYRPSGATGDGDLHAPDNPSNDGNYGLSHIEFCTGGTTTTTTQPTTTTTTQPTTTTTQPTTTTTQPTTTTTQPTTTTTQPTTTTTQPTTTTTQPTGTTQPPSISPQTGAIVITKVAAGAAADDRFGLTSTYGSGAFDLGDGESNTATGLAAGFYIVNESETAGWVLTGIVCDDPSANTTVDGATANIDLAAGETVRCTFTNARVQVGGIQVEATTTTVAATVETLPFTGAESNRLALAGLMVLVAGALLLYAARRDEDEPAAVDGDVRWTI